MSDRCQRPFVPYKSKADCVQAPNHDAAEFNAEAPWAPEYLAQIGMEASRALPWLQASSDLPWLEASGALPEMEDSRPMAELEAKHAFAESVQRGPGGTFASPANAATAPDKGPFDKRVTLTFDDGPDVEKTPLILEILQKQDIKATFFIQGDKLDAAGAADLVQLIRDKGHIVANHSENHRELLKEPQLAPDQITATQTRLEPFSREQNDYFRFPYGGATPEGIGAAESAGYAVTGWHMDSADWCYDEGNDGKCEKKTFDGANERFPDDMTGNILEQAKKFDGGILLFHDTRKFTVAQLNDVIIQLSLAGFTFTNLDDTSAYPILNGWSANLDKTP